MFFNKKSSNQDDRIKINTSTITTFVGVDSVFEGTIRTKASLRVDGTVIGDIRSEGVVVLTKTGKIVGTIEAESIIVAGTIEGNMSIRDKVNVEPSGKIYGEIVTSKFVIDEESIFQGNCIMNRDGAIVPVTPYKNGEDEKVESAEEITEDNADSEKDKKSDEKSDKETEKQSEKKDKEEKKAESEKKEDSEEKSEDADESKDEKKDDEIEIADIDELTADEAPEDAYIDSKQVPNPKRKNIKKSKSLSVEIEEN